MIAKLEESGTQLIIGYDEIYFMNRRWPEFNYQVQFLYNNTNLLNNIDIWAENDDTCGIIELIYKVLTTNQPDYWKNPSEPWFIVTIIPNSDFPEIGPKLFQQSTSLQTTLDHSSYEYFTVIASIDSRNFGGIDFESGNGLSLYLHVSKEKLEQFVLDLEKEFKFRWQEFIQKNNFNGDYPVKNYDYWKMKKEN